MWAQTDDNNISDILLSLVIIVVVEANRNGKSFSNLPFLEHARLWNSWLILVQHTQENNDKYCIYLSTTLFLYLYQVWYLYHSNEVSNKHRIKIVLSFLIEKDITFSGINKNIWNKSGETDVKETNCLIGGTIRYIWQNCIYIFVVTCNLWINYALSLLPLQKKEINLVFKLDL